MNKPKNNLIRLSMRGLGSSYKLFFIFFSGKHLAEHCADAFPRPVRYTLWVMAEIAIICVDCQEVVGTAIAINILSNGAIKVPIGVLMTALFSLVFLLMDRCVRQLELFFGILIAIMSIAFGVQYFDQLPPQGEVLAGSIIPRVPASDVSTAVGLIGAVIMPHNLYLHSALVLSRNIDIKDKAKVHEAVYYNRIDSTFALLFSFVINLFVVCVFANCQVEGVDSIGLGDAGDRLTVCYDGRRAFQYIFAVGLLASGQAATVTSTYAGQYVMQGYLNLQISAWKRSFLSRAIAIGPGLLIAIVAVDHIDDMQEWLNVVQSIQLPFAIIPLLYFVNNKTVLGSWVNSAANYYAGWAISLVVVLANVYLVGDLVRQVFKGASFSFTMFVAVLALLLFGVMYVLLVGWLVLIAFGRIALPEQIPGEDDGNSSTGDGGAGGGGGRGAEEEEEELNERPPAIREASSSVLSDDATERTEMLGG